MKTNSTREMIDILESFELHGKVLVKVEDYDDNKYTVIDNPNFDFSSNHYKPYVKPIECYVNMYAKDFNDENVDFNLLENTSFSACVCPHYSKESAFNSISKDGRIFKLIEVLK